MIREPTLPWVVACVPHYRCKGYVRAAVESLLSQTYRNIFVVVVNDGDPSPPWDELRHIDDRRLIRFGTLGNQGPYFATDVVLRATSAPYLLIQDADDWSVPCRVERLLARIERDRSEFAVSSQMQYRRLTSGELVTHRIFPQREPLARQTSQMLYRLPHHGLWRTRFLKRWGGYYAGFRFSYDLFLTNLARLLGKTSYVEEPLYCRVGRSGSLTTNLDTGIGSAARVAVEAELRMIFRSIFGWFDEFRRGRLSSAGLQQRIRAALSRSVVASRESLLIAEAARLAKTAERVLGATGTL